MIFASDGPSIAALSVPKPTWGAPASLGFHAALLAAMLLSPLTPRPEPPAVRSIAVDLISPEQFTALIAPTPSPPPTIPLPETGVAPDAMAAEPEPAAPSKPTTGTGTIRATEFYSGKLLAEPSSAGLLRALRGTEDRERLVQICGIEAMEQVRRARPEFDPDIVVAYAFADTEIRDGALVAEGAAFRSRREWYGVKFTCKAAADLSGVGSFEFSVGDFIPHEEWDAHYLTAEEAED
jgi:hypothetical protein